MEELKEEDVIQGVMHSDFAFSQQTVYADLTGMGLPKIESQGHLFSQGISLSQLYLLNFENTSKMGPILGTGEFMMSPTNIMALYRNDLREDLEGAIKLPKPRKMFASFAKLLQGRRSSRYFPGEKISTQDLSDLLFYSSGAIEEEETMYRTPIKKYRRPYPSGGGMYSIDLFLAIYNVAGIDPGIYLYQPVSHTVLFVSEVPGLDKFLITGRYNQDSGQYDEIENLKPAVLLVYVNNIARPRLKYGELCLLLGFVDCGCMVQNASLAAAALNHHFCVWAGFKKTSIETVLKIDGLNKHVIMTALLGGKIK